jgi:hypothetical protein
VQQLHHTTAPPRAHNSWRPQLTIHDYDHLDIAEGDINPSSKKLKHVQHTVQPPQVMAITNHRDHRDDGKDSSDDDNNNGARDGHDGSGEEEQCDEHTDDDHSDDDMHHAPVQPQLRASVPLAAPQQLQPIATRHRQSRDDVRSPPPPRNYVRCSDHLANVCRDVMVCE